MSVNLVKDFKWCHTDSHGNIHVCLTTLAVHAQIPGTPEAFQDLQDLLDRMMAQAGYTPISTYTKHPSLKT